MRSHFSLSFYSEKIWQLPKKGSFCLYATWRHLTLSAVYARHQKCCAFKAKVKHSENSISPITVTSTHAHTPTHMQRSKTPEPIRYEYILHLTEVLMFECLWRRHEIMGSHLLFQASVSHFLC